MLFYKDLYRKCDFLCEGCIDFYYERKCREMLGTQKYLVLTNTMLPISYIVINVNHMNGIIQYLSKMEISIYYVMDAFRSP